MEFLIQWVPIGLVLLILVLIFKGLGRKSSQRKEGRILRKSATDRSINGVCGGIAEYYGVSSFLVRFLFLIFPIGLIVYLILANTMEEAKVSL